MDNEDVVSAAQSIWGLYLQANGATFSLGSGSLAGEDLHAVSVYGDRTQQIEESDFSIEVIAAFAAANLDLLAEPRNSVGIWLSAEEGIVYLDVSITVQDRQTALALAREHGELAICHLLDLTVEYIDFAWKSSLNEKGSNERRNRCWKQKRQPSLLSSPELTAAKLRAWRFVKS